MLRLYSNEEKIIMWEITNIDFAGRPLLGRDQIRFCNDLYLKLWRDAHKEIILKGSPLEITIEEFNEKILIPTIQGFFIPNAGLIEFGNNMDESSSFNIHKILSMGEVAVDEDHDRDFYREFPVEFMNYIINNTKRYSYRPFQKSVYKWGIPGGVNWRGIKTHSGFEILMIELFCYKNKMDAPLISG
jgi:hypothetical protein